MGRYLQLTEVPTYCEYFDDITESTIGFAEDLIDQYLGDTLVEQSTTDKNIRLSRKNTGKLSHTPVSAIVSVTALYKTNQGLQSSVIDADDLMFTPSGYIELITTRPQLSIYSFCRCPLYAITVDYKYGFATIPNVVKRVTAMIAQNIAEKKSFGQIKSYTDLNVQMTLFDNTVFTKDIRMLLDGVKNV